MACFFVITPILVLYSIGYRFDFKEMKMTEIWNPETELGENQAMNKQIYKIAYVENAEISNYFEVNMEFKKVQQNVAQQTPMGPINIPQEQIVWRMIGQGWK